jgi:hypothetical protein
MHIYRYPVQALTDCRSTTKQIHVYIHLQAHLLYTYRHIRMNLIYYWHVALPCIRTHAYYIIRTHAYYIIRTHAYYIIRTHAYYIIRTHAYFIIRTHAYYIIRTHAYYIIRTHAYYIIRTHAYFIIQSMHARIDPPHRRICCQHAHPAHIYLRLHTYISTPTHTPCWLTCCRRAASNSE